MYVSKNGVVYFINDNNLYKILPGGSFAQVAAGLATDTPAFAIYSPRHSIMGIWMDNDENVYVANFSGQSVKKVATDGSVSTVYNSKSSWSPSGGVFDKEGNLWLLEYSLTNEARAIKIDKNALPKT